MKPRHLQEFRASGIDDELSRLNFTTVDQEDAFALLTYAIPQAELRRNDGRLRDKYLRRFYQLEEGGWAVNGLDPDTHWTTDLEWGRLKPDVPRRDWDVESHSFKDKLIKYESPAKTPNRVTYFRVDLQTWERVTARYGVKMPACEIPSNEKGEALGFWSFIQQNPQIPVILTEGEKKAAALLSRGYAAIALPGIYCGTVKDGNVWRLHPDLVPLAQKGRKFYIVFDYEPRANKARHLNQAIARLGKAIEAEGANCHVAQLPGPEKGVDDWLVALCAKQGVTTATSIPHPAASLASLWVGIVKGFSASPLAPGTAVRDLLAAATPLKTYCRLLALPKAFARLVKYQPNLTVNERYLSVNIPSDQRLVALKGGKGTGKTQAIAAYINDHLLNFEKRGGRRVLVPGHRVQLGAALCERFGLPYLADKASFAEGDLFGLGLCVDSLHQFSKAKFNPKEWEECIIVLDEIEQVLWHLLNSATCRRDRVEILSNFREVLQNASQVIIADADLSDVSLDYLKAIMGCDPWILENTYQSSETTYDVTLYEGNKPNPLILELTEAIARGEKPFVLTSSQKHQSKWSTRTLEKRFASEFPELRILRIDSHSVADKTHPAFGAVGRLNELLPHYDLVIASPSIETGVSIDVRGHFTSVWALATGVQTVFSVAQALARLRENVPRHVWIAERGSALADGSIHPKQLRDNIQRLAKAQCKFLEESKNLQALWQADFDGCEMKFQPHSVDCWAQMAARINAGALNYRSSLVQLLQQEGHRVRRTDSRLEEAKAIAVEVGECRDLNYAEHRSRVADPSRYIEIEADFEELSNQIAMTEDERETVKHNQIARRYRVPVTPELVEKDDEGWYRKLQLHYYTGIGREFLNDTCWRSFAAQSKSGAVFEPDFANHKLWAQVKLWEHLGLNALENVESVLSVGDPVAAPIAQKCRDYHRDIQLVFGLTIPSRGGDIHVLNAMFRLRDQKLVRLGRKRLRDGQRPRVYSPPVAAFVKNDMGKPIGDKEGQLLVVSDGRERIFGEWRELHLDLRQNASERLEKEQRASAEAKTKPMVELPEKTITKEMIELVVIGRPETVDAALALAQQQELNAELSIPDWNELIRRINTFRFKHLSHEGFVAIRARFGESLNTMSDCQLLRLLQFLEQTFEPGLA